MASFLKVHCIDSVASVLCEKLELMQGWSIRIYLGHLLSVGLGVQGGFCQQSGVLLRGHTQLIVEGVMPDLKGAKGE